MSRLELPEQVNPQLLQRAAELRRHMTPEERIVWQEVRGNRLGVHFRRQHPLPPYIVDFYCHQARLMVELDGSPHRQQQGYDKARDAYLARCGIRVLRMTNDSVRNDLPTVLHMIRDALRHSP
jgi:very-short-patch-repair endonuclease